MRTSTTWLTLGRMWRNMRRAALAPMASAARTYSRHAVLHELGAHLAVHAGPAGQRQDQHHALHDAAAHHRGKGEDQQDVGDGGEDVVDPLQRRSPTLPPKKPPKAPSSVPISVATDAASTPTKTEISVPLTALASTSRPSGRPLKGNVAFASRRLAAQLGARQPIRRSAAPAGRCRDRSTAAPPGPRRPPLPPSSPAPARAGGSGVGHPTFVLPAALATNPQPRPAMIRAYSSHDAQADQPHPVAPVTGQAARQTLPGCVRSHVGCGGHRNTTRGSTAL
jgi:hypothetical protein